MKLFAVSIAYVAVDSVVTFAVLDANGYVAIIGAFTLAIIQILTWLKVNWKVAAVEIKVNEIAVKTDGLVKEIVRAKDETKDAAVAQAVAETTLAAGAPAPAQSGAAVQPVEMAVKR